jgi:hypothetical protein
MPVIVDSKTSRAVVIDRTRVAAIVQNRPSAIAVADRRTTQAVTRQANVVGVASTGVQGPQGERGLSAEAAGLTRTADGALGGHRIVRSTGAGTAGYASADNPLHGDDTLGMTTGAAGDGAAVTIQTGDSIAMDGWAWTPGEPVFLGLDGQPTQQVNYEGFAFVQAIGFASDATTLVLQLQPAIYF